MTDQARYGALKGAAAAGAFAPVGPAGHIALAQHRRHHFSKATLDRIVLVEGHGVEGDAHAGAFVRHRSLSVAACPSSGSSI